MESSLLLAISLDPNIIFTIFSRSSLKYPILSCRFQRILSFICLVHKRWVAVGNALEMALVIAFSSSLPMMMSVSPIFCLMCERKVKYASESLSTCNLMGPSIIGCSFVSLRITAFCLYICTSIQKQSRSPN